MNEQGGSLPPLQEADAQGLPSEDEAERFLPSESSNNARRTTRKRVAVVHLLLTLLFAGIGFQIAYQQTERNGISQLTSTSRDHLKGVIARLGNEIDKFGIVPQIAAHDQVLTNILRHPDDPAALSTANDRLVAINRAAGTSNTYVINNKGVIVASDNWNQPTSFIGRDISYRPYFQKAKPNVAVGYYGVGTTGDASGYYLATAIESAGDQLGVVAVKVGLEQLEHNWLSDIPQSILVTDANGVVILSSHPSWKYHTLGPVSPALIKQAEASQQYNRHPLTALDWRAGKNTGNGSFFVRITQNARSQNYLAASDDLPHVGMRITILSDPTDVQGLALSHGIIAVIGILLISSCAYLVNQRRLVIRERLRSREALHHAYQHLQHQFEERSEELRSANHGLRHEIAERIQAVKRLEAFQEELIRTENLAVIGQLSAGLAHEINQPLAALSTLSENAVRFLELNDLDTARFNLQRIGELVVRMGELTGQLKSFARRSSSEKGPVDLPLAIESAMALLSHQLDRHKVNIEFKRPHEKMEALAEVVRLEQVLVNLISNAMDAVTDLSSPKITVTISRAACPREAGLEESRHDADQMAPGERLVIAVQDNGAGLTPEVQERLFEPFFTTKKTSGLGLGLAISKDIIRSFGGDLVATNGENGGAMFKVILKTVEHPEKTYV